MMIKESYISFDTSKMLKEAGINILTSPYYRADGRVDGMSIEAQQTLIKHYGPDNFYPLFTQDSVGRWLRDKYGYHIGTNYGFKQKRWCCFIIDFTKDDKCYYWEPEFKSHEEAFEFGLQKALTFICKNKTEN